MRSLLLGLPLLLLALPAAAVDGVLEINQTCATQTGCFSGDAPGFPVSITGTAGRSYRLTSDLKLSNPDLTAVSISADHVSLDLGGFRISCFVFVPPSTTETCYEADSSGAGLGVDARSEGARIWNGSVVGTSQQGVAVGTSAVVRDLHVSQCGLGISTGRGAMISGTTTRDNASSGIVADEGCVVSGNAAYLNSGNGISAQRGSIVSGNASRQNSGYGLSLTPDVGYVNNVVTNNGLGQVTGGDSRGGNLCVGTGVVSNACP